MSFTALSLNNRMTALFFLFLLPVCFVMKWFAFRGTLESKNWLISLSLFPSPESLRRALPLNAAPTLLGRILLGFSACACAYWFYWNIWQGWQLPPLLLSYFGAIILWLVSETLGSLVPLLTLPTGRLLSPPHGSCPLLAKSLSEFWGQCWNLWMSDLFRRIIFRPMRTCPVLALLMVFLVSGVLHEWVINMPLYLVTGKNCFGSMIVYFLLQAGGILVERRTRNPVARRILVWVFVFGAVPLIVNEGLLRILHLWPA